jgi:hypothetical protein
MVDTLLYVILTLMQSPEYVPPIDYCTKNVDHLPHTDQITFYIGCSEVNGRRVYPDRIIEGIYNGKKYTY